MAHNDLRTNKAVRPADFTPARNEEFYRFANGDFDITVLSDGHITVPVDIVHPDGSTQASGEIFGYYVITSQYFKRYRLPIMHTETNIKMPACRQWLLKQ